MWIKVPYTLFLCILVPVYAVQYGLANFLWFSDIALLVTLMALWRESRLLASMQAVSVTLLEGVWIIDFVAGVMTGSSPFGLAAYMFDPGIPLFLRALSLFHLVLPPLLLWLLSLLGYDSRAWIVQTLFSWVLLPCAIAVPTLQRILIGSSARAINRRPGCLRGCICSR